jgi:hypothetical protein
MAVIRPFVEEDIPQVTRLHRTVFPPRQADAGSEPYRPYFARVFLDTPARVGGVHSLVYQEDDGRIVGFVGVVPRRMSLNGESLRAAVTSQFAVDPASRAGLVVVRLVKALLDGPQDLSIADEANDAARAIWERLGGTTALLYSLHWTRPLRPAGLALSLLRARSRLGALAGLARPLARLADSLAARAPRSHFRQAPPRGASEELPLETWLASAREFGAARALRMDYDERVLRWLVDRARGRANGAGLEQLLVGTPRDVKGWAVYQVEPGGVAEVLQIGATASTIDEVLEHLFHRAWRRGAIAVSGRLEPGFAQALSDRYCLFHRRGPWMLVHARKAEVLQAFQRGDGFVSRLDGEWCLRFTP